MTDERLRNPPFLQRHVLLMFQKSLFDIAI